MSEPFVGEIRMFAGNFAPRGWAFCDGQLLAVAQNDALFSLFGTTYGGDGRTTFGLPDMRGRIPIHAGSGPGLSTHRLGAKSGGEQETLTVNQMPSHSHDLMADTNPATEVGPVGHVLAQGQGVNFYREDDQSQSLSGAMISATGGSRPHSNLMPTLCVNFIVALFGIYPSRH
ncbi:phage tail protein [Arenibacterium sp. LLYu02]|uniref:phage tail protein n=1 Tax=Arenibacterium sp. LLYu02 TaxID=3404132 RepID=UPI003B223717